MKKTPDSDQFVDVFDHERIFLWNPTIREALELAKLSPFDPKGTFAYGLDYDFSTDDYKVVRVARPSIPNVSNETQVELLEMKSNIWRTIQGLQSGTEREGVGVFLHGALHWLAARETGLRKILVIVAFHMVEETFYEIVPPYHIKESKDDAMFLGISGDYLCLFRDCEGHGSATVYEAWLLEEDGVNSSWTRRLFSVDSENLLGYKYYTKTGKVVIDYDGRELLLCSPKENTSETFTLHNQWDLFRPAVYIESLVSPHFRSATNGSNDTDAH
ncbi:hypothetical protein DITRI_Ditri15bG0049800 [Diplodiscus trichospermus]